MPGVRGIASEVVRPWPDAALSRLVLGGVVIAHRGAANRTACEFLEEIRELFTFATALPFLAKERHVLHPCEQRRVNDFGVVPRNDFLANTAFFGLEFGNVFADNSPITQEFVHIALMPDSLSRVPSRDALLVQSPNDDATPVALHVHVEDATDELRTLFEHMNLAVTHLEPSRDLARHEDAFLRQLALRLPVGQRPEGFVLRLAVRPHHVRQDREKRSVRGKVEDHVLCCEADSDAVLGDLKEQQ